MEFARRTSFSVIRTAVCALLFVAAAVGAEEVLSIHVSVALEQIATPYIEDPAADNVELAQRKALEETALVVGGMIYGWAFEYEIGERARGLAERFTLTNRGRIEFGDPRLTVIDAAVEESKLAVWTEYRPDEMQARRIATWKNGNAKPIQGIGSGPLTDTVEGKREALEDAARAAIRAYLRGTQRNRPKEARGEVALVADPRYWIDAGRLTASARFRVVVDEIVPFAAY